MLAPGAVVRRWASVVKVLITCFSLSMPCPHVPKGVHGLSIVLGDVSWLPVLFMLFWSGLLPLSGFGSATHASVANDAQQHHGASMGSHSPTTNRGGKTTQITASQENRVLVIEFDYFWLPVYY